MILIPAIDLLDGRCVRLRQGDYAQVTVYSDHPEEIAMSFEQDGAGLIHIVDLNGALKGETVNYPVVEKIVKNIAVPIEIGGGIREAVSANRYVDLGVKRIIIGTKACESPGFFETLCRDVKADIIAGIDARDGKVAVNGWTSITDQSAVSLARLLEQKGGKGVIYTDISRDGMRTGPNIQSTLELARSVKMPVIASGGVSREEDVFEFMKHSEVDIYGIIVGKAIYEGDINLKQIIGKMERMVQ